MANEFLDYMAQNGVDRAPAAEKSLFEKWLYGEPVTLNGPSSIPNLKAQTVPVQANPITSMPEKRITTPMPAPVSAPAPIEQAPMSIATTGLSKQGIAAYDKAIKEAEAARGDIQSAVSASEQARKDKLPLPIANFYGPTIEVENLYKGTGAEKGLKGKVAEYDDIYQKGMAEVERIKSETDKDLEANRNEIDKNAQAKWKYAEDLITQKLPEDTLMPKNIWSDASVSSKIGMGIGLLLSATSDTAMRNSLKIISDNIERDIQKQKYDNAIKAANLKEGERRKMNAFDARDNVFKNKIQTINAMRAEAWSDVAKKLAAKNSEITNKQMLINNQAKIAAVQQEGNRYQQQLYDSINAEAEAQRKEAFTNKVTLANSRLSVAELKAKKAQMMKESIAGVKGGSGVGVKVGAPATSDKISAEIYQTFKNDKQLYAKAMGEAGMLKSAREGLSALNDNFEKAKKITTVQKLNPFSEAKADLTELETRVFLTLKNILGERFSDKDYEATVKPFVPSSITATDKQIDIYKKAVDSFVNNSMAKTPILEMYGIRQKLMNEKPIQRYK